MCWACLGRGREKNRRYEEKGEGWGERERVEKGVGRWGIGCRKGEGDDFFWCDIHLVCSYNDVSRVVFWVFVEVWYIK